MSNEKKIRDLLARMVSMTPPPPPFPEETINVSQRSDAPRRSPALIFGVAAVMVAALAVPLLLSNFGDQPVGGDSTTTTTTAVEPTTTVPEPTTTTTDSTTTTQPAEVLLASWPVYLVQPSDDGGNPSLVPFEVSVFEGQGIALDEVDSPEDMLFNLEELSFEIPAGFESFVPDGVEIVGKSFESTNEGLTRVVLDMNEAFLAGAGGHLADVTMLNQIVWTTLQFEVAEVLFTVGGRSVTAFGSEGISLVDPIDTSEFLDEINPIILRAPVSFRSGSELVVTGIANVFEATLSYRVTGTDIEGFTTASCGTGCWGEFEILVEAPDGVPAGAILEIFVHSAQDGSPTNVVRIPMDVIARGG